MSFYFFLVIIISFILLPVSDKKSKYKLVSMIIVGCIITLIVGLRHYSLGMMDTEKVYNPQFNMLLNMNFKEICLHFKDPIFYIFTKIITIITDNKNVWYTICATAYIIPIMHIIYKESKYPLISVLMFISLNYFGFAFSGIRHCIALGITCMAYYPLRDKKIKKFIILILIASTFHISAIISIIIYPLYHNIKFINRKKFIINLIVLLSIFCVIFLIGNIIVEFLFKILIEVFNMDRFSMYANSNFSSLNYNLFFINFIIYVLSGLLFYNCKNEQLNEEKVNILLNYQYVGTIISGMVGILGEFARLSMFLTIFSIICLPEALKCFKYKNTRTFFEMLCIVMLICYFLFMGIYNYNIVPYLPCWYIG